MSTASVHAGGKLKNWNVKKFLTDYLIVIGILALAAYTAIVQPAFLSQSNLLSFVRQFVPLAFVALGMTLIIISGYIDLSVAGLFSLMGIVSAMLMNQIGEVAALPASMLIGAGCGAITASILVLCGARDDSDALFLTYGMQMAFGAVAMMANGGNMVALEHEGPFADLIGNGTLLGIPFMLILFIIAVAILHFFMKKTPYGRSIHIAGGNPLAANLCGIRISRIIFLVFALTGALTALGAYIQTCRVGLSLPVGGRNYETYAILSVTVGGTSLAGGKGSVLRTVLGVAVYTLLTNSLNILGVDPNMQFVWKGVIMIAAIWIDSRRTD